MIEIPTITSVGGENGSPSFEKTFSRNVLYYQVGGALLYSFSSY